MDVLSEMTENVRSSALVRLHGADLTLVQIFMRYSLRTVYSVDYIRLRSSMTYRLTVEATDPVGTAPLMGESLLRRLERQNPDGLTSGEILRFFADASVPLSEATLRKYVQLGLLPRSIRVGRKGKHQGSQGIYPVGVVRQIWQIKQMMANNYTIEQIQREVLFMRSELEQLERTLCGIFVKLDGALKAQRSDVLGRLVSRKIGDAKVLSAELQSKLGSIERQLTTREVVGGVAG